MWSSDSSRLGALLRPGSHTYVEARICVSLISPVSPASLLWVSNARPSRVARVLNPGEKLLSEAHEVALILAYHFDIVWPGHSGYHGSDVDVLAARSYPNILGYCDLLADRFADMFNIPGLAFGTTVGSPLPMHSKVGVGSYVQRGAEWVPIAVDATPIPLTKAKSIEGRSNAWDTRAMAERKLGSSICLVDAPIVTVTIRNVSVFGTK
jgi:hypothetical protein